MSSKNFYVCTICGKKLIQRKKNGVWRFVFGTHKGTPPVEIEIYGHVKMKCIRRSCKRQHPDHWNIFNFFPTGFSEQPIEAKTIATAKRPDLEHTPATIIEPQQLEKEA